jgi:hypothetical protein
MRGFARYMKGHLLLANLAYEMLDRSGIETALEVKVRSAVSTFLAESGHRPYKCDAVGELVEWLALPIS